MIRKIWTKIALFCAICSNIYALEISDFQTDLYSKTGKILPISMQLEIIGDDLVRNKILDSLNTVISGYFYEDIFTERGKESLKATLIKYAGKKHSQNIDEVLILRLKSLDNKELLERLKESLNLESASKNLLNQLNPSPLKPKPTPMKANQPNQFDLPSF